jgi:translocation and assembly module TamB
MAKKIIVTVSAVIVTALVLVNAALLLSNAGFLQAIARTAIDALIPGSITWDTLSISPYTGRVRVTSAALLGADKKMIASFRSLDARVSVPALLRGRLIIREATLDGPAIDFSLDKEGTFNLLQALGVKPRKTGKKKSLPRFLSVERLVLTNGSARWSQPSAGIAAGLDDINISAALDFGDLTGDIAMKTGSGFFSHHGRVTGVTVVSASGLLKNGTMGQCSVETATAGSRVAVRGGIADLFVAPRFDVTAGFTLSLADLCTLIPIDGTMTGSASGNLTLRGLPGNPSSSLRCSYGGGDILGSRIDGAYLDATIEDREVTMPALIARAAGGSCAVTGTIRFKDAFPDGFLSRNRAPDRTAYELAATLTRFPLAAVPGGRLRGAVNSTASVKGTGFSAAAATAALRLNAATDNFSFGEGSQPAPLSLAVEGGLDRGLLKVDSFSATLGGLRASGAGSLDRATGAVSASVSASSPDLAREAAALGMSARGSCYLDAALSGTTRRPALSLRARGEGLRYGELALGSAACEASLEHDGTARLSDLSLVNGRSRVSLSGSTRLLPFRQNDRPLTLEIRTFDVQLADFHDTVAGHVTMAGSVGGSVMAPAGSVRMSATALDLGFQKLDAVTLETGMRGGRINLDLFTIDVALGQAVRIGGWITPAGAYRLTVSADGIALGGNSYAKATGMDGKLDMDLEGEGTLADPSAKGSVTLRNVRYRDRQFDDFRINISLADRVIRANGKLNFDLSGHYDLTTRNFNISLLFDRTDISPFFTAAANPGMSGTLSGSLSARGNLSRLQGLEVSANLSDFSVSSGGRKLVSGGPLRATLSGGVLSVPPTTIALLDSGWIRISGSGPLRSAVVIDAEGLVPVELAGWFSGSIANPTGTIRFTAGVRGDLFSPALTAGITLRNIGFDVPALGSGPHGVSGAIDVRPGLISTPGIRGTLGNGTIGVSGAIGMKGLSPRDIMVNVRADHAGISVPDMLDLDFNARLNVAGPSGQVMVRGDVTILRGLYYQDLVLHPFQNIGARRTEKKEPAGAKSALDSIGFDVALLNRNPFEIDNNIARLTINNNLRFTGTAARPVLNGSLRVESGSIFYLGREFVINSGKVDFLNPYRIDPTIDIKGSASIQGWNVQIGLSGKLDALAFTLSSQPVLDSSEILSLILLGKTKGKKSSLPAGQLISEAIALTYGDTIKKKTGIDSIEIRSGDEGKKTSSGNFSAMIGKNLNDRVTYYYTVGRDERGLKSTTTLEYKFFDNIMVDTEYDSSGKAGASIRYSKSFR